MKLIVNARQAHRLWTVRLAAAQAALGAGATAYAFYVPGRSLVLPVIVLILGVVIGVARVVRQPHADD